MIAAISQRNDPNKHNDFIDSLANNYVNYFEKFGITLLPVPNTTKDIVGYFDGFGIERIILSGGNSIDPALYNGKDKGLTDISKERDATEKAILQIAVERKIPVLGICRGMQFINVFFGGKLLQVKDETGNTTGKTLEHVAANHTVEFVGEKARALLGEKAEVNSYHGQGIAEEIVGQELKVFAKSQDNIVEGIHHTTLPIAGIEWHPERKSPDQEVNRKITEAFLKGKGFWK